MNDGNFFERLSEAPIGPLILLAAYLPMVAVHGFSLHGLVLTKTMRAIMRRCFPLAAIAATVTLFLSEQGFLYAYMIIVPFLQWHVVKLMYDWYVRKSGRPPRSYGQRSVEGDTADEFMFSLVSGLGVFALPLIMMMFVLLLLRTFS